MNRKVVFTVLFVAAALLFAGCTVGGTGTPPNTQPITNTIAGHEQSLESVLRSIPVQYINYARNNFKIAYEHTSHGTHVSRGLFGLEQYKAGDAVLFGISTTHESDKLYITDAYLGGSIPGAYSDLSTGDADWNAWIDQNRAFLNNDANDEINVIVWSWCNIGGHDADAYCDSMQTLINEYGENGTKIGTGPDDTRPTPVTFIFMTGHGNGGSNPNPGQPETQAQIIVQFCEDNGYWCLDFYSNDSHTMNGVYYNDAADNGNSTIYSATVPGASAAGFYTDWQAAHTLGTEYFQGRNNPGGTDETLGAHTTQHITLNRNAYAFWWILARMAGWGEE